eukprot:829595-Pelagomonas_calceolata.AAC.2
MFTSEQATPSDPDKGLAKLQNILIPITQGYFPSHGAPGKLSNVLHSSVPDSEGSFAECPCSAMSSGTTAWPPIS